MFKRIFLEATLRSFRLFIVATLVALSTRSAFGQASVNSVALDVTGKYYWELVFNYDNSDNGSEIEYKATYHRKKSVNYKDFLSSKLNITSGYKLENQSSTSIKYDGFNASNTINYSVHQEVASELVSTSESATTIDDESDVIQDYHVAPHSKLALYRLCYIMDGVTVTTDTVSTTTNVPVFVQLHFTVTTHILGLGQTLNQFAHTFPGSSNVSEWANIRNEIVGASDTSEEVQFKQFVQVLAVTHPTRDNIAEWNAIAQTSNEVLRDWQSIDKQALLIKLLNRFSVTKPGRDNIAEWTAIRNVVDPILHSINRLY